MGNDAKAWTYTFIVFGLISIIFFMLTFLWTRERTGNSNTDTPKANVPLKVGVKALAKNKYWIIMTAVVLLLYTSMGIGGGATVYYARLVLGNEGYVSQISMATTITQIVCMFLVAGFVKKFGKRNVMIAGSVIGVIGFVVIIFGGDNLQLVLLGNAIRGLGGAGMAASMFAMISDTIEYGEWKSGVRTEGLINSASSIGQKVGGGLSAALFGAILSIGGYVGGAATQSDSAIAAVKVAYIYVPMIASIISIVLLFAYKLDKEYPAILEELKRRNSVVENEVV